MSTQSESRIGRPADLVKREAIVAAAAASFFDVGYAATSIEQVATDAGVSKVTIYNHFKGKHGLFTAAVEHECELMRSHFEIAAMPDATLRARLRAIGEGIVAFLSRPEMIQFERRIAAETEREPAIGAAFLEAGPHRMKAAFSAFLAAMAQAGQIAVPDTDLAAEQFVSMCKGMGDLERRFGHSSDDALVQARIAGAVDVFCAAYATDKSDRISDAPRTMD